MTYLVKRKDRFYVVVYDGLDPLTGRERRRWHPVGVDRAEAEAVVARLRHDRIDPPARRVGQITFGDFLTDTWLPIKRRQVRAATAYRYAWFAQNYIVPAIGVIPVAKLRADHLDALYEKLDTTGGRDGTGLAPKTIHEVHMIIRACLDRAVEKQLVARNVAYDSHARPTDGSIITPDQTHDHRVDGDEDSGAEEPARERIVITDDGVLDDVGEQEQDHQIEAVQLRQVPLATQTKQDQEAGVHPERADRLSSTGMPMVPNLN